jgi:uncharacterized protein YcnI
MRSHLARRLIGAASGATLMLAVALPASAHITIIDGSAVPGGGFGTQITFRVPHGCDGAPTDTIEVQIPEGVTSVKPKWTAGWDITTEPRAAAAASVAPDASAAPATPEVGVVRWSGASLPDSQYMDFQLRAVFPDAPGSVIYFPVVQRCGDVEEAWIQIPAAGQTEDDLELPAPAVSIVAGVPSDD